jgi:hypothetical protein
MLMLDKTNTCYSLVVGRVVVKMLVVVLPLVVPVEPLVVPVELPGVVPLGVGLPVGPVVVVVVPLVLVPVVLGDEPGVVVEVLGREVEALVLVTGCSQVTISKAQTFMGWLASLGVRMRSTRGEARDFAGMYSKLVYTDTTCSV